MTLPWREIEPLPSLNGAVEPVLDTVDSLRIAWDEALGRVSPEEFAEARQRNLRRHAIETGIIERLYDLEWGVTEALVAEGITAEVAEREGGVSPDAFRLIRDQLSALDYLVEAVRDGRDLTIFFVRELHQLITRHQPTYEARDAIGNLVQVPLAHGDWKTQPNHVRRLDGTLLAYCPPEHVQSEMERLVELYGETVGADPVVRAAWLHHRFIQIHPFADGNGRVARALTLLVLLQNRYAPLVVDRRNRTDYIAALDAANDGDLRPLIRLFAQFEIVALRTELERPAVVTPASGSAVDIARAHADRLTRLRADRTGEGPQRTARRAVTLQRRIRDYLQPQFDTIASTFYEVDGTAAADVALVSDDTLMATWFAIAQLTARQRRLEYSVHVSESGTGTGVLVVSPILLFGAAINRQPEPDLDEVELRLAPTDTVTIAPADDIDARWPEVKDLIDFTLAAAIQEFGRRLG